MGNDMYNDEQLAYAKTRAEGVAVSDHDCVRCPQCDSCPACAADALDREVVANEGLTSAWEAHKKAYEIVRAEMDDLHKTLTVAGVPEQIPPFKTALAPAKARVLYLSARCNQLFDEAADAQEQLDQFEAYAITVKSALDDRNRVAELEEHDKSFSTVVARLATAIADRDALREALREIEETKYGPAPIIAARVFARLDATREAKPEGERP